MWSGNEATHCPASGKSNELTDLHLSSPAEPCLALSQWTVSHCHCLCELICGAKASASSAVAGFLGTVCVCVCVQMCMHACE